MGWADDPLVQTPVGGKDTPASADTWGNDPLVRTPTAGDSTPTMTVRPEPQGPPRPPMSALERFGTGLKDPFVGAAQLTMHAVGKGEQADRYVRSREADIAETTPNPDQTRTVLDQQGRASHVNVGKIGGTDPIRAVGAGLSPPNLVAAGVGGPVVGGVLSGAMTGALSPTTAENYWREKLMQTGTGAVIGGLTGGAGKVAGGIIAPELRPAAQKLVDEGVHLTPGQMKGGYMRRVEDSVSSVPLVGAAIRKDQQRSVESFNRVAIDRSLADINAKLPKDIATGHDSIAYAQDEFSKAYNQVIPNMRGIRDPTFVQDLNDVVSRAQNTGLPQQQVDQLVFAVQNEILNHFDANGHITGDVVQRIGTQLDRMANAARLSPDPHVQLYGRALDEMDAVLQNMMAAHNPSLQAAKDRIDAGYAKFKTVQRASSYAGTRPDGTFTPAQLSGSVRARDKSKDKAAFARGDALMQDLADDARDVLPRVVPDSGTPERAALIGAIAGGHFVEPHVAAALGLAAVPYAGPVSDFTNWYVRNQAPWRGTVGNAVRRGAPYAAPAATELTQQQLRQMLGIAPQDSGTDAMR